MLLHQSIILRSNLKSVQNGVITFIQGKEGLCWSSILGPYIYLQAPELFHVNI